MSDVVRVSCSGLCLIQNNEGSYLLGFNRNVLPDKVLTPLGGALQFYDATLLNLFDAQVEHNYSERQNNDMPNHDLRLSLPAQNLEAFNAWFIKRKGREISPFRELQEELTREPLLQETPLLRHLEEKDLRIQYLFVTPYQRPTARRGYEGTWTYVLAEIYRVEFLMAEHLNTIAANGAAHGLRWVTKAEIWDGITSDQLPVSARILLEKPI